MERKKDRDYIGACKQETSYDPELNNHMLRH
jgi:hypothetical protein